LKDIDMRIQAHATLRERIAGSLRDAIVNGSIASGTRFAEPDLAERFGISRTPVREALRQLESEGFITVVPRKGAIVASLSAKDVSDFYDLKMVLEGYAAHQAARTLTAADVDRMATVNDAMLAAAGRQEWRKAIELHNEFHDIFVSACGNERLAAIDRNLVMQFQRFRLILAMHGSIEGSARQHREIIQAFRDRDAAMAETLVRKNAAYGKKLLLKELGKV
jgi:DNA-binding GntR family transcriptional regulator